MKVNLFNHWFKYKVPVDKHREQIVDRMQNEGQTWAGKSRNYMRNHFWGYVNDELGAGQYYKWSEGKNYLCFDNEKHYMMFLLKL